jgi:hypothetical protein
MKVLLTTIFACVLASLCLAQQPHPDKKKNPLPPQPKVVNPPKITQPVVNPPKINQPKINNPPKVNQPPNVNLPKKLVQNQQQAKKLLNLSGPGNNPVVKQLNLNTNQRVSVNQVYKPNYNYKQHQPTLASHIKPFQRGWSVQNHPPHGYQLQHNGYNFGCYCGCHHYHWQCCGWHSQCGCPCWWDSHWNCWYYWCAPDFCFYPVTYCPYDTYVWADQNGDCMAPDNTEPPPDYPDVPV